MGIQGNEAAKNERPTVVTLPYSNFKPMVKRFITGKWSDFWPTPIENKLHSVQPTLGCGPLSNRERLISLLINFSCELGQIMTRYDFLWAR